VALAADKRGEKVPRGRGEALEALRSGDGVGSALPGEWWPVCEHYKRDEWERFLATVSDWDVEEYLDVLP